MAVLPTPAGPTSAGLFFPCRSRMSIDARDLLVAAAHRLEAAGARVGGEVARESRERAAVRSVSE